jgi:4-carboxymuconolactone decarboxylase
MSEKSPRIAPLPREEWTDDAREVFGFWEGAEARENGSWSNTMMTLANHPELAMSSLNFGKYLMLESTLTARQQKMIVLRVAARTGSAYQWTHNSISARQIGYSDEEIEAIREGAASPVWQGEDRVLMSVIDQLSEGGRIDDASWAEMAKIWDRRQIMDVLHAVGYFTMVAWALIAMRVQVEPNVQEVSVNRGKDA